MLRLLIILLVVYLFVRFFKRMSLTGPGQRNNFQRNSPQDQGKTSSGPPFDDIEEAEFTEVKEEKKEEKKSDSQ